MEYRSVGKRIAAILDDLRLPISDAETIRILGEKGFRIIDIDLIALARSCVGVSQYQRGARAYEAPSVVDCSGLMKWLYGERGIWLPRRSIQQREYGERIALDDVIAGDLIFVSGYIDYYFDDPADGVGHVGIATGEGTVIHAAGENAGVVESSAEQFLGDGKFRGARRYIPRDKNVVTFDVPMSRDVEVSDDLRWIVLQSLPVLK